MPSPDKPTGKQAVIFDLFFTLLTADIADDEFPPTHETLGVAKQSWREQTFGTSHKRLTGVQTDPYRIVESMAHAIDPTIPDSVVREATELRIARFEHTLMNPPESTLSVLRELRQRGLKTALISNADTIETQPFHRSPLASMLDVTVLSWEVGLVKPQPEIYQHCLELLGLQASQCIFVGDGGSNELSGARSVGLTAVFATGIMPELTKQEVEQRKSIAHYTIGELTELLTLVNDGS
ncbi:MAG: HAD-IA family hydrolase [Gammaproteobacteria bacterium]|nr:HAD-IA family hydrolase [Gammaproteobacteria bacterium]